MRAEMGKNPRRAPPSQVLNLPAGFRFYPTDEELVVHYLSKKAASQPFAIPIIAELELYKYDPWDLPAKALFGEREWYFFSPRDRKYPNGSRPNRAAREGYWKATGTDKPVSTHGGSKKVGVKKALVFYRGKSPKGIKTNWIMHEYRLADVNTSRNSDVNTRRNLAKRKNTLRMEDWVLCRIYKKSSREANEFESAMSVAFDDIRGHKSESSCLDEVLEILSELDDSRDGVHGEAEEAHTYNVEQIGSLDARSPSLDSSVERPYEEAACAYSSGGDARNYVEEASHGTANQLASSMKGVRYMVEATRFKMGENAATREPNVRSRQHSLVEPHSESRQQEEDLAVESTFDSLAGLPPLITHELLSSNMNTQNLGMASNSLYGLELGLPSPCTMLAQGASFGMDPDNPFFQSSHFPTCWDPTKVNFSS